MAEFFGTVQGGRGKATRLGHANTGLDVTAQSYEGSIIINMYVGNAGVKCVSINVGEGSTAAGTYNLYRGPIKGLFDDMQRNFSQIAQQHRLAQGR
jgi:hypothetical protein